MGKRTTVLLLVCSTPNSQSVAALVFFCTLEIYAEIISERMADSFPDKAEKNVNENTEVHLSFKAHLF